MDAAIALHHSTVRRLLLEHNGYESATEVGIRFSSVLNVDDEETEVGIRFSSVFMSMIRREDFGRSRLLPGII